MLEIQQSDFFRPNTFIIQGKVYRKSSNKISTTIDVVRTCFGKDVIIPFQMDKNSEIHDENVKLLKTGKIITVKGHLNSFRGKNSKGFFVKLNPTEIVYEHEEHRFPQSAFVFGGFVDAVKEYDMGTLITVQGEDGISIPFYAFENNAFLQLQKAEIDQMGTLVVMAGSIGGKETENGSVLPTFNNLSIACLEADDVPDPATPKVKKEDIPF